MKIREIKSFIGKRGGFVFVIIVNIVILILSRYFWDWLSKDLPNGDAVRNIALSIGGVWAIYAVFLAAMRVRIMQQQQVSEGLARAAEQLSSDVMSVRILAIFSLGNIAMEVNTQTRRDVIKVLCSYVREKCSIRSEKGRKIFQDDLKQIIYVLSNIQNKKSELGVLDFSNTNMSSFDLSNANLSDADFINTNLSRAHLRNADLSGATLYFANLSDADLTNTNLSGVQGLHLADNLETVTNPPPEILAVIQRQKRGD